MRRRFWLFFAIQIIGIIMGLTVLVRSARASTCYPSCPPTFDPYCCCTTEPPYNCWCSHYACQ